MRNSRGQHHANRPAGIEWMCGWIFSGYDSKEAIVATAWGGGLSETCCCSCSESLARVTSLFLVILGFRIVVNFQEKWIPNGIVTSERCTSIINFRGYVRDVKSHSCNRLRAGREMALPPPTVVWYTGTALCSGALGQKGDHVSGLLVWWSACPWHLARGRRQGKPSQGRVILYAESLLGWVIEWLTAITAVLHLFSSTISTWWTTRSLRHDILRRRTFQWINHACDIWYDFLLAEYI